MEIAKYVVGVQFTPDQGSIRKLDAVLKSLETKLEVFSKKVSKGLNLRITTFSVNEPLLTRKLEDALDVASAKAVFRVTRFSVDQDRLDRTMQVAVRRAATRARANVSVNAVGVGRGATAPRTAQSGGGTGRVVAQAEGLGVGAGLSRLYGPALAIAAGGYGLAWLNKTNQKVVAAQLQSQAVVQQNGGTIQQGDDSFKWLKYQANRVGFDYLQAAPQYNQLLAGLTQSGLSVKDAQTTYKGFSELSRVNKLDDAHQKRLMYAVSEVGDMDQLQKRQLKMIALALPGGISVFAQAYQKQLAASGQGKGDLTGAAAEAALNAAIKAGKVKGDILPLAGQIASDRAAPNLDKASHASQAEQARYRNSVADLAKIASDNGVEEGFARLFRVLNDGLEHSGPLVKSLAQDFNTVTKYVKLVVDSFSDLQNMFAGKDSFFGDKFFPKPEDKKQLLAFLDSFKNATTELSTLIGNVYKGWKDIFDLFDTSPSLKKMTDALNALTNGAAFLNHLASGDTDAAGKDAQGLVKGLNNVAVDTNPYIQLTDKLFGTDIGGFLKSRMDNNLDDPAANKVKKQLDTSDHFSQPMPQYMGNASASDIAAFQKDKTASEQSNTVTISINIDAATMANMDVRKQAADLASHITSIFDQAKIQFPMKEQP